MRILLVDDHILFRDGLAGLLTSQPDMMIVGQAGSVREALVLAQKLRPDVVLMDITMADGSGLEATRLILNEYCNGGAPTSIRALPVLQRL
jgi:DNA-binding NarL/FixJ family response regulator